ncbi:unnamed protein product [Candidula unifasciata]|uniref:Uncharacterized protein n=1 Tax=Candidula unifasciata TaxID=100452 RepID=A0A8S3YU59_9EUPU|nr:unnamed protein product [Candidula unifasciata]
MASSAEQIPLPGTGSLSAKSFLGEDLTCFPLALLQECYQRVSELHTALCLLDKAGTHLTQTLVKVLEHTAYRCVGGVLRDRLGDVFTAAASQPHQAIVQELESVIAGLISTEKQQMDLQSSDQTLCQVALLVTKMESQYFSQCHRKMSDLLQVLLHLQGEDPAASEVVTQLLFQLGLITELQSSDRAAISLPSNPWASQHLRVSVPEVEPQSSTGLRLGPFLDKQNYLDENKGHFFADATEERSEGKETEKEGIPTVSVTAGSFESASYVPSHIARQGLAAFSSGPLSSISDQPVHLKHIEHGSHHLRPVTESQTGSHGSPVPVIVSSRSQLATEEELESVINLLSGIGYGSASPMQVIPEVMPAQGSMQLTVPQIYRTLSPLSDTHLEDRRKSQVHRRSEGCLDLSAMGHHMWPHQHQCHHRASLPSVQIFSASGHRCGYDPPSPVPPYVRDSPSPNYSLRDPPSPGYFHGDPPSPFRTNYAKTLGIHPAAVRPSMLSPVQWSAGPPASLSSSRLGGLEPNMNQHGTWPVYGGMSSVSPSVAETSSWVGTQDCSDLSDDSSNEDQFFTVGKDLSHLINPKDGSSDDEADSGRPDLSKSSNTWPPPDPRASMNLGRGLTPELLGPPETCNSHKPIQMQWSDPLSARSVWQPASQDPSHQKTSHSMQGFGGAH